MSGRRRTGGAYARPPWALATPCAAVCKNADCAWCAALYALHARVHEDARRRFIAPRANIIN